MLGLLIDWGYRSDGIPVQLFGAWTTLPAGPATLAAKTGSRILPVAIRRQPDGTVPRLVRADPIDVPSSSTGRPPAGDAGDRRRARGDDRRGARAVVQLQADLAADRRRRRAELEARADADAGRRVADPGRRAAPRSP